jgi:hypothetical protein
MFSMARTPNGELTNKILEEMPTCDDVEVVGSLAVYEDAKDPWFRGSLGNYDGAMEWYWQLSGRFY